MAAENDLFIDGESGLPLPIYPSNVQRRHWDWHHHFFPVDDPRLQGEGGRAVAYSRIQHVPRSLHQRYHRLLIAQEGNIPLPTDTSSRIYTTVLALAKYLPRQAVDVSGASPKLVELDDITHQRMRSHQLKPQEGTKWRIGNFMMNAILDQGLYGIDELTVEEFIETPDFRRRQALGHKILEEAIERGIEPVDPLYRAGWRAGLISPACPPEPVAFVQQTFAGHQEDYFDDMQQRLLTRVA